MSALSARPRLATVSRFAAVVLGGYLFTYGFVALATLAGFVAGLRFFDSQVLAYMLSLLVFMGAVLWGFTPRRNGLVWAVLAGGGAVMSAVAWSFSHGAP